MTIQGETVVVTGADGFIGSHLTEALVRAGASVRALVYYNSFGSCGWLDTVPSEVREKLQIVSGDVRDVHQMDELCKGAAIVFHLAALIGIPFSYVAPDLYVDTNIKGTLNILQAARRHNVKKLVHTSTSEVYGTAQFVPITEQHPICAQSPYAATKASADQLALSFHQSFGLPVAVVRPFNTYGPRQSTRAVIPTIITQLTAGKSALSLGSVLPTRDFSYVADTVRGMMAVAETPETVGRTMNLGSSFEISIHDTAMLIAELMGKSITLEEDARRVRPKGSEVERLWADTAFVAKLTGWKPQHGGKEGFRKGLEQTIRWFQDPANRVNGRPGDYQI